MSLENPPRVKSPEPEEQGSRDSYESRIELSRLAALEILERFDHVPNFEEVTAINDLYSSLKSEEYIVRRENPETLLHTVEAQEPIDIHFTGNIPYANAVIWNPELNREKGLATAFLEGQGHVHNVVTVYGFEKPEGMFIEKIPETTQSAYGTIDRSQVRAVAGFVPPEAISFIVVRIPLAAFPENRMTEREKDLAFELEESASEKHKAAFIYRGYKSQR